jgi:hypothetical protein
VDLQVISKSKVDLQVVSRSPHNKETPSNFHGFWSGELHCEKKGKKKKRSFDV